MMTAGIERIFRDRLEVWRDVPESAIPFTDSSTAPIWMCWLQGSDHIPETARAFIRQVQRHAGNHPIRIIDLEQAKALVDIPESIMSRYQAKSLPPALLTDFIRIALLEKYGGIWLDMTVWVTDDIPDTILDIPFWSVKGMEYSPFFPVMPNAGDWQIYFMAGQPNALFYRVMKDLMISYFDRFTEVVDYYMQYYFATIIHNNIPAVKESWNKIPANNTKCALLFPFLLGYEPLTRQGPDNLFDDTTFLYKLSGHIDLKKQFESNIQISQKLGLS